MRLFVYNDVIIHFVGQEKGDNQESHFPLLTSKT